MSELRTNKVSPASGTALALADSGDTITVPSGATLTVSGTMNFPDDAVTTAKIADNAVTLAKLEDGTQGDILYYAASGAPTRLAKGTASQQLAMNSGATAPEWVTVSSSANTPYFWAKTTADSAWGSGSYTTIVLNSVVEESSSGSFDTSTYKFTVPSGEGGTYFLGGQFFIPSAAGAYYIKLKQGVGGSTELHYSANQGNGNQNIQPAWVMALAAGDTLEWSLYGGSGTTNGGNQVWGWKLW